MAEASGSRTHQRHKCRTTGLKPAPSTGQEWLPGTIVAESLQAALGGEGYTGSSSLPSIPRSSNGRTAAFGAVNRGSNPCRGATPLRINNLQRRFDAVYEYSYTEGVSQAIKSLVLVQATPPELRRPQEPRSAQKAPVLDGLRMPNLDSWSHARAEISFHDRARSFSDLKRAEALRASLMAQVQTDSMTGPPVSECIEKYLATREQDLDAAHPRTAPARARTPAAVS